MANPIKALWKAGTKTVGGSIGDYADSVEDFRFIAQQGSRLERGGARQPKRGRR